MTEKLSVSQLTKKRYRREHNRLIKKCCFTANAVVRLRDKVCQRCGRSTGKLDVAHVIVKQHLFTRFDILNLVLLCFDCHRHKWHEQGDGTRWFAEKFPARWHYLDGNKAIHWKPTNEDLLAMLDFLEEKLKELEAKK